MADANVHVNYLANASKMVSESKKAAKASKGVGESAKGANKQMANFAGTATRFFAGTAVAAGMASFVKGGIEMADTADLIQSSWAKTFGDEGPKMLANLEAQRKAMGLAEFETQQLLLKYGQLSKSMGLSVEDSAAFSSQLFTMAGDVAAFSGKLDDAPAVLDAFGSALKGEFDALEAYGVILKQDTINQKALTMTGKESVDQLTAQEKAAALMALITEQLADETGALGEAMASGATDANVLTAEMKDAQTGLGQTAQILRDQMNKGLLAFLGFLEDSGHAIADFMMWLQRMGDSGDTVFHKLLRVMADVLEMIWGVGDGAANMARRWANTWNAMLSPVRAVSRLVGGLSSKVSGVASRIGRLRLPGFAAGGIVPGAPGAPQLAVVHGGENVQTPAQQRAGGGGGAGIVNNITVNAGLSDPHATAMAVVDLLRVYQRTQGNIPFGDNTTGQPGGGA